MLLKNKTILITGASSGIGSQIAIDCANEGAKVIVTGRNKERLNAVYSKLSGKGHLQFDFDMTNENATKNFIKQIDNISGLVHCAGVLKPYPIKFLTSEKIDETMKINFNSAVYLVAQLAAQKKISKNASFVFMSSISGQFPHKGNSLYCASKAAIETFSKTVALEFQHLFLRSNCICPAMIKTPMYDEAEQGMSKELMDQHIAKYPLGVGYPEDISNMAQFLLSDKSRWLTGQNIKMDGGFTMEK